jgi:hypothetical protein
MALPIGTKMISGGSAWRTAPGSHKALKASLGQAIAPTDLLKGPSTSHGRHRAPATANAAMGEDLLLLLLLVKSLLLLLLQTAALSFDIQEWTAT